MDYTKLSSAFIYKNRTDINEFTKNNELNNQLARIMHKYYFLNEFSAEDKMLACFNTAYYICTILLLEETPYWRWREIYNIAGIPGSRNDNVNRSITLSLVLIYLQYFADEWKANNQELIKEIETVVEHTDFYFETGKISKGSNDIKTSFFCPRTIDKETLLDVKRDNFNCVTFTDFFKKDIIVDLINHLGKTAAEKLLIIYFLDEEAKDFYGGLGYYLSDVQPMLNQMKEDVAKLFFEKRVTLPIFIGRTLFNVENILNKTRDDINEGKVDLEDKMTISSRTEENKTSTEQLKILEAKDAEIAKLKAEIEILTIDNEGYELKEKCMPAHQAAILVVALCRELKQMPANGRELLSPLLQLLWGFTESTSKQALRKKITQEQAEKVAKKLDELKFTPKVSRLVRELPKTLEKENRERLQNLNKAH